MASIRRLLRYILGLTSIISFYMLLKPSHVEVPFTQRISSIIASTRNSHASDAANLQAISTQESSLDATNGKYRVYLDVRTRLGNVLFETASGLGLSVLQNRTLVITGKMYQALNATFKLGKLPFIVAKRPKNITTISPKKRGSAWRLRNDLFHLPNESVYLHNAYMQSWRYFGHIQQEIRKLYTFHDHITVSTNRFLQTIQDGSSGTTFIGVHIRRGDMANVSYARVPSENYTLHAMEYFRRKYPGCQFIVCSDDIAWCQKHLSHLPDVHFSEGRSAGEDLGLLAACHHTVVQYGTYAWWGAWLAGGEVTYYDQCLPKKENMQYAIDHYYLPQWIPMSDSLD